MEERPLLKQTEQVYQKETFADALALFQALADNAPVLIWMAGPDRRCSFFNKRWLHFTGRTMEQEEGDGWLAGIHADDLSMWLEGFAKSFKSRGEFAVKYRLRRSDGSYRWMLNNSSPFYLPSGEFAGYIGSCTDVTESVSQIDNLERQNYLIKTITDNATVGLFLVDRDFKCTFVNAAAEQITGYSAAELRGSSIHQAIHHSKTDGSPYLEEDCELERSMVNMEIVRDLEENFIRKNGKFFAAVCSTSPIINEGEFMGAVLEIRDIEAQRAAEARVRRNEDRFRTLIEKSSDVVSLFDGTGNILYSSPSLKRVLGYTVDELRNGVNFSYIHPADADFVMSEFGQLMESAGNSRLAEIRVKHANGSWRWIETVGTNLLHDPNLRSIVVNFRDITERKLAEEKAQYQYYHDTLTDLPNRNYFSERLAGLLDKPGEKTFGVMILDLDRFKMINESLGHAIGDRLIQEVGLRLADCLEEGDILARLGGDEFGIILPNIQREAEIGRVCSKILEILKPAFRFEVHELYITPSIGISVAPYDGNDVSSLMKNADSALYRAKELGRNNFQYYNPSMNATTFQQLAMENTLRKALENNEFLVYYEPQIDMVTGKIVQVEALIRWMHPELGLTFPNEFIPIAETTGLIVPIGEWVLHQACEDIKKWNDMGYKINVSVNMSMRQLRQKHLVRTVRRIIAETGIDPQRLELELTESVLMENSHAVYNSLTQLRKEGLKFAIDDFNTGYSSLNYIKRFPIDVLKIDRSFVKGIPSQEKDAAIANSVINLAHSLNMVVVGEGVERVDQLRFLRERGCDRAQGYLFSSPVPEKEIRLLIERGQTW